LQEEWELLQGMGENRNQKAVPRESILSTRRHSATCSATWPHAFDLLTLKVCNKIIGQYLHAQWPVIYLQDMMRRQRKFAMDSVYCDNHVVGHLIRGEVLLLVLSLFVSLFLSPD